MDADGRPRNTPYGLDLAWVAAIGKQVLEGLDHLHKLGHVHRDLRAGNILMDYEGNVILSNFSHANWGKLMDFQKDENKAPVSRAAEALCRCPLPFF